MDDLAALIAKLRDDGYDLTHGEACEAADALETEMAHADRLAACGSDVLDCIDGHDGPVCGDVRRSWSSALAAHRARRARNETGETDEP